VPAPDSIKWTLQEHLAVLISATSCTTYKHMFTYTHAFFAMPGPPNFTMSLEIDNNNLIYKAAADIDVIII